MITFHILAVPDRVDPVKEMDGNGETCCTLANDGDTVTPTKKNKTPFETDLVYKGLSMWMPNGRPFSGVPDGHGMIVEKNTGRALWDFGMCSYLGIGRLPVMIDAAKRAYDEYGLCTNSSRSYMELPLLREVEELVSAEFGGHFLATPKTHIGTMVWATATVAPDDLLLVDREAHVSIHHATDLSVAKGTRKVLVPHGDTAELMRLLRENEGKARRVWYCIDGVHSMGRSMTDPGEIRAYLAASPKAYIFCDDAHGIGWAGENGRGAFLENFGGHVHERMIVAVSLCKAVEAGGGGLLYGDETDRDRAAVCGLPMHWTAPCNPAILAATKTFFGWVHTDAYAERRSALLALIDAFNNQMHDTDPPVHVETIQRVPIKVIHIGLARRAIEIADILRAEGFYVCPCTYPVTKRGHAGLRITFNAAVPLSACLSLCTAVKKYCSGMPPPTVSVYDPDLATDEDPTTAKIQQS